jgi:hypothetical protein
MSDRYFNRTLTKDLLARVFSSMAGTAVRPDGIKFVTNEGLFGLSFEVSVEYVTKTLTYSKDQVVGSVGDWMRDKLGEQGKVTVYTTDNGSARRPPTEITFLAIGISDVSEACCSRIAALFTQPIPEGPTPLPTPI